MTKVELARCFKVSTNAVSEWVRRGCPCQRRGTNGKQYAFDLPAVMEWRVQDLIRLGTAQPSQTPLPERPLSTEKTERIRLLKAKADLAEMDLRARLGDLLERESIEREWFRCGRVIRNSLLNIPARIDAVVAAEPDVHRCHQIIMDEITSCLHSFTRDASVPGMKPSQPSAGEASAEHDQTISGDSHRTDSKAVGARRGMARQKGPPEEPTRDNK